MSIHAYKSTSNDIKGFSWKDLPFWKYEILHVYIYNNAQK
jgi:hypothetical protein